MYRNAVKHFCDDVTRRKRLRTDMDVLARLCSTVLPQTDIALDDDITSQRRKYFGLSFDTYQALPRALDSRRNAFSSVFASCPFHVSFRVPSWQVM